MAVIYNRTQTPLVCDSAGHIIDARGWRSVDVDQVTQRGIDAGDLVEVDTADLERSGSPQGLVAAVEVDQGDRPPQVGYDRLTVDQLQEELRDRGLPTSGNKGDLVARLEADDEGEE